MNFELTEDQQEIKRTARELLGNRASWEKVREAATAGRYDEALWRELTELGWPGIAVAEEHGGQGLGTVALCVLLEELGYTCAPTPFLGTVLAAQAIEHAGSTQQRERWLPALASGEATGAFGVVRGDAAELVPDAPDAGVIVLADSETGGATVLDGGAASVEEVTSIDSTRRYGRVSAEGGEPLDGDAAAVVDRAAVAVAAELVGVCQRALDMTLEYVKDRKQFGVPVGSFQAVQHRAAQMLLDTEGSRSTTYFAAWTADAEPERLALAAAMAKAWASDAGRSATGAAIQLHGGVGFTWEADVHWLFKRAQLDAAFLGGAGAYRARVAQLAAADRAAVVR
jgi:alkylation response protein AidB-like acyl-CoA dehydrogenase